jgi:transcriptional regulator with XRE-family HTH domain
MQFAPFSLPWDQERERGESEHAGKGPENGGAEAGRGDEAFPKGGLKPNPTDGLLRAVRQAVGIPLAEIAKKGGVVLSTVTDFELRELERTITLRSLGRMAEAMGCKVVYGVVPMKGSTLEHLAEERLWRKVLGRTEELKNGAP